LDEHSGQQDIENEDLRSFLKTKCSCFLCKLYANIMQLMFYNFKEVQSKILFTTEVHSQLQSVLACMLFWDEVTSPLTILLYPCRPTRKSGKMNWNSAKFFLMFMESII